MLKNNKTSLTLIKDFKNQNQIKHFDGIYYYIRKLVKKRELLVK